MLCANRFKVRVRDLARGIVNAVLADSTQGATIGNSNSEAEPLVRTFDVEEGPPRPVPRQEFPEPQARARSLPEQAQHPEQVTQRRSRSTHRRPRSADRRSRSDPLPRRRRRKRLCTIKEAEEVEHGAQTVADEDSSSGSDSEASTFDFSFNPSTEKIRKSNPSFDERLGTQATGLELSSIFDEDDLFTFMDAVTNSVELPREIKSLGLTIKGQRKWLVDLLVYKRGNRLLDTFNRRVRVVRWTRLDCTRGTPQSAERYAVAAVSL